MRPIEGLAGPTARTRPAASRLASAWETVGFDRPAIRASPGREEGPAAAEVIEDRTLVVGTEQAGGARRRRVHWPVLTGHS